MRIDKDDSKIDREKRADLIRRYQEEQAKLDQGGKDAAKLDATKPTEKKSDIQATELNHQAQRTEIQKPVTGAERTTEAIDAAHKQQARGENWQKFEAEARDQVPASVEEKAQAEKAEQEKTQQARDAAERQDKERLSVRELQNDLAVKQRMIRS